MTPSQLRGPGRQGRQGRAGFRRWLARRSPRVETAAFLVSHCLFPAFPLSFSHCLVSLRNGCSQIRKKPIYLEKRINDMFVPHRRNTKSPTSLYKLGFSSEVTHRLSGGLIRKQRQFAEPCGVRGAGSGDAAESRAQDGGRVSAGRVRQDQGPSVSGGGCQRGGVARP